MRPCSTRSNRAGSPSPWLVTTSRPVPCHPDVQLNQPPAEAMADALTSWAGEWSRDYVVVDTHGGGPPSGDGAIAAAGVVVVPVPPRTKDLNATEGMVHEIGSGASVI